MSNIFEARFLPDLIPGKSKLDGRGLYSGKHFRTGDVILEFGGRVYARAELPDPYEEDLFLQVGTDRFLGPDDRPPRLEDLVNHSCDHNAAVFLPPESPALLVAIRPIEPMEEIAYDYSLLMVDDDWTMTCRCTSPSCRRTIREYRTLPSETKMRYQSLGAVPSYVLAADHSRQGRREGSPTIPERSKRRPAPRRTKLHLPSEGRDRTAESGPSRHGAMRRDPEQAHG